MLSNEGAKNLDILRNFAIDFWRGNVSIQKEEVGGTHIDTFLIALKVYGCFEVLIEYEIGTFAFKLWTGTEYVFLDKLSSVKIIYGFDSMIPENIKHNFEVLNTVLELIKANSEKQNGFQKDDYFI